MMRRSLMWGALALSLAVSGVALAEPGEGSFTPTSLLVPIRKVTLEGSGASSTLYSCDPTGGKDCLVDVADNTALAKLFAQPAAISVGTYDAVGVYNCGDEQQFTAKVKGSVVLSGVTWYTAGSNVLSLDAADLDYVSVTYSGCKVGPNLAQPIAIHEGDDINISAFFTLANVAWVSSGLQTASACTLTPSGTPRSVCVALPELVSYVGTTAPTVETYYVTEDQSDTTAVRAGGQVLLLVDGSANVFGGFLRRLFSDTSRPPLVSYDAPLAGIAVNADGTDYTAFTAGPTSGSYGVDFPAFQRQTHDGTFTWFGSTDAVPYRAVKK
jgi:hypothetical protein